MKGFFRELGQGVFFVIKTSGWLLAVAAISVLLAVVSVPAAVVAGGVAVVGGWWSRGNKTLGTIVAMICLVVGVVFFLRPGTQNQPFASCSVYPIPFLQKGGAAPLEYVPSTTPVSVDPKPWIAPLVTQTRNQLQIVDGATHRIQQARAAAIAHARDCLLYTSPSPRDS